MSKILKHMNKVVNIPSYLHELHGNKPTILDLLLTYGISIVAAVYIFYLQTGMQIETIKFIALVIVTMDIAGGAVANFTTSTNQYYKSKIKLKYIFILLHVIQPAILIWIFPQQAFPIIVISGYTLFSMIILHLVNTYTVRRTLGAFLLTIGLISIAAFAITNNIVELLLVLFSIKLLIGFSVGSK